MRISTVVIALSIAGSLKGQPTADVINYINTYKQLAIEEMQRTGVPASIKLAQGIHETSAGKSDLVLKSNNHFGIKCKDTWSGARVFHDDDARGECFRSYPSPIDSYMDHSDFLKRSARYAFLFNLDPTDYKAWAYGLKKAGYATNIKYSQIIIKLIEVYNLEQYSLIALGRLSPNEEIMAVNPQAVPDTIDIDTSATAIIEKPKDEIHPPSINYPTGEFRINNTNVIFSRSGTSLLAIAQEHDIPLSRLLDFNDLKDQEILERDQLIFLQRKRKVGSKEYHIVLPGETLYDISQAEGIRLENLAGYNHLQLIMNPAPGEKLNLQTNAAARPLLIEEGVALNKAVRDIDENDRNADNPTTHIVQTKETLFSISKKYGVAVEKIMQWNKLNGFDLKVGQELLIHKN